MSELLVVLPDELVLQLAADLEEVGDVAVDDLGLLRLQRQRMKPKFA